MEIEKDKYFERIYFGSNECINKSRLLIQKNSGNIRYIYCLTEDERRALEIVEFLLII